MQYWLFIIEVHGTETPYIVKTPAHVQASAFNLACRKLHELLRKLQPGIWTCEWSDFAEGIIERGEQTCYGPFDGIPMTI